MTPLRFFLPALVIIASSASLAVELSSAKHVVAELAPEPSASETQRSTDPIEHVPSAGGLSEGEGFDEVGHAHDHDPQFLTGADLAVVESRGYTVQELSNIHEYSRTREKKLLEVRPSAAQKSQLESSLGAIEVASLHILERYIPGQIKIRIADSFARAHRIMTTWNFPAQAIQAPYAWKIFVKDSNAQERVSGFMSSERCHSAWMGPPANLFVVADRFLTKCGSSRRRSGAEVVSAFDETMVHEIAHAVEFQLMGRGFGRRQRWHSEGFATWFESLPADPKESSLRFEQLIQEARQVYDPNWNPSVFGGSKTDYARSFGMLATLAGRHSPEKVFAIYRRMGKENIRFDEAVQRVTGWNLERWIAETDSYLHAESHGLTPPTLVARAAPPVWDDVVLLPDLTSEF